MKICPKNKEVAKIILEVCSSKYFKRIKKMWRHLLIALIDISFYNKIY